MGVQEEHFRYAPGDRIGGEYHVLQVFGGAGKSGMGVVYLVEHKDYAIPFVLKTFQINANGRDLKSRFLQEAEVWVRLGIHPNIVRAMWVREIDFDLFVAAEYVAKDEMARNTIRDFIPACPKMLPTVLQWVADYCYGMSHALEKGLVAHRDIKPENLLVDPWGRLKITDFGLARSLDFQMSANDKPTVSTPRAFNIAPSASILGTLPYVAPELFVGRNVSMILRHL